MPVSSDSTSVQSNTNTITDVKRLIKLAYTTKRALFIHGRPGIGKSSVTHQVAEELKIDLRDVRLNQLEPVDLRGLPMIDQV